MVIKGILKLGVLGGAVYATQKAGIWGDSTQTTENIKAYINSNPTLKYYSALTPTRKEVGMKAVDYWNDEFGGTFYDCFLNAVIDCMEPNVGVIGRVPVGISVKATFKHLLKTPQYTKQAVSWCTDTLSGLMEEPKAAPSKDTKKPSQ